LGEVVRAGGDGSGFDGPEYYCPQLTTTNNDDKAATITQAFLISV
jgi:hypothetical protein